MNSQIRKTLIFAAITIFTAAIFAGFESNYIPNLIERITGRKGAGASMIFTFFLVGIPLIHALTAYPKKMPFHWVFVNTFIPIVGYAFFLFFLVSRDKLSLSHSKYNQTQKEDAEEKRSDS